MHPNVKALLEIEFAAQKSQEWLALRGNMLTASDAATALGVNKYETPAELLLKKCGMGKNLRVIQPQNTVSSTKMRLEYSMNNATGRSAMI